MSLLTFLKDNPVSNEPKTYKIKLDGRLKDAEPFVIKTIDSVMYKNLQNMAIKNGKVQTDKVATSVVVNSCTEPKFNDVELIKELKVATPEQAVEKLLTPGEISALALEIIDLSGLTVSADVLEEEVKN